MANPLKDFLTRPPLLAMMSLESRLPVPKLSQVLFRISDALPDFGPPKLGPRSVDEVLPELAAPRPTEIVAPPPPLGAEEAPPPVKEEPRKTAEFLLE